MWKVATLLGLILLASSQQCCLDNSVCPSNASCLCENTVDSCIFEITDKENLFTINTVTSYYNWVPAVEDYASVAVVFCDNQTLANTNFSIGFYIQDPNGTGYPSTPSNNFPVSNGCMGYSILGATFCTTPQGGFCNLIVSVALSNGTQSTTLGISIISLEGATKFIIPILISVGCVLLIVIIFLVGWMIRKRMLAARQEVDSKRENNIDHFQSMLPKVRLDDLITAEGLPRDIYNCSVCLGDIEFKDEVRRTICSHIFHADCMDVWCRKNITCPMCREPLDQESLQKRKDNDNSSLGLATVGGFKT